MVCPMLLRAKTNNQKHAAFAGKQAASPEPTGLWDEPQRLHRGGSTGSGLGEMDRIFDHKCSLRKKGRVSMYLSNLP